MSRTKKLYDIIKLMADVGKEDCGIVCENAIFEGAEIILAGDLKVEDTLTCKSGSVTIDADADETIEIPASKAKPVKISDMRRLVQQMLPVIMDETEKYFGIKKKVKKKPVKKKVKKK